MFGSTQTCPAIADSLELFAGLAREEQQPERAARLLGATQALREKTGMPLAPFERAEVERDGAAAREAMHEEGFRAAWDQGRALSLEQAVAYALEKQPAVAADQAAEMASSA